MRDKRNGAYAIALVYGCEAERMTDEELYLFAAQHGYAWDEQRQTWEQHVQEGRRVDFA